MKKRKGLEKVIYESEKYGEHIVYRLYDTNIMVQECGYIKLNTGGWYTRHTKNCINDNLPEGYRVFQEKGEWYVNTPDGIFDYNDNMKLKVG